MSGGAVCHMDSIEFDNDGYQGLPTSVNAGSALSIPQAWGTGGHGGTTQSKHVNLFSHKNEKSDIDIGLKNVFVPKNKQSSYGSKDYLHILKLSVALLDPQIGVISHFIAIMMGRLIVEIKPIISKSMKPLLAILLR